MITVIKVFCTDVKPKCKVGAKVWNMCVVQWFA